MRNIEDLLREIFRYESDEHPLYRGLVEASSRHRDGFNNVRVESPRFGIYGVIPCWTWDNHGNSMAFYSAERNWENGGPQLEHPRLSAFQDNAHNYHGVLINCLAYMSGKDWSRLHLIKMTLEPPDKYYQLKSYRPDIAELFLSVISGIESEQDQAASRGGRQFTIFQK